MSTIDSGCSLWDKSGNNYREHMFSGLTPEADIRPLSNALVRCSGERLATGLLPRDLAATDYRALGLLIHINPGFEILGLE